MYELDVALALANRDDEEYVPWRFGRAPQNSTLTVLRYLSDKRQYKIKLDAALIAISKLKMLFNT